MRPAHLGRCAQCDRIDRTVRGEERIKRRKAGHVVQDGVAAHYRCNREAWRHRERWQVLVAGDLAKPDNGDADRHRESGHDIVELERERGALDAVLKRWNLRRAQVLIEDLAEIDAGNRPAFAGTWYNLLNDGRGIIAEGPHPDSGPMAIVGGMGAFRGTRGDVSVNIIGTNSTGCPNMRLTFNLLKK